jgi:phenylacetic acid degradation operon negative regulatory protein
MYRLKTTLPHNPSKLKLSSNVAKLRLGLVLRANSLLITLYGDALAPRGQAVWLGSLISLMELFDLSSRLVRTSAFRLTADDWLVATRVGRRSFYALSETGQQRVQNADRRIYEFTLPAWDGCWTLAMLDTTMRASDRQILRRELLWEGFGQVSANLFAHPHGDHSALQAILKTTKTQDKVAVLRASGFETYSEQPLQNILHQAFKLTEVALAWQQFIARFKPMLDEMAEMSTAEAFFVRILLIHEYRRVLLRDPHLPEALLARHWPGVQGRQLCEALYRGLLTRSEQFLCSQAEACDGPLGETPKAISRRLLQLAY